ncbi:hypothetical protein Tco_0575929 [Tanacetum coccineum]
MFEDYFERKSSDTTINSAAQPSHDQEVSPSTSSIIVDTHEAPPVVTTSDEQTSPISLQESDEFNQEIVQIFRVIHSLFPFDSLNQEQEASIDLRRHISPVARLEAVTEVEKALYDIKQAPRAWYDKLSSFLIEHGFNKERLDADLQGTPTDQTTYHRMIGGLMYLTASRPDIAFPTFVCARYLARPTVKHLKEVKRIFWYLRQSYNMGLWYPKDSGFELIAYSDADHASCKDDCKSHIKEGVQFLGGKARELELKKQDCTAISTAEAEYVSLFACCAQVIWMRTQLLDYGFKYNRIPMYCDSKSAIAISCNPVQHSKTKHIELRIIY